jgi:hypothetical protein
MFTCQIFDFKSIKKISDDDDDTSGQIEYFSQFYFRTKSFSQLKSLSILGIEIDNMSKLLFLTNLVSLTMKSICGKRMSTFDLLQLKKKLVVNSCRNKNWLKVIINILYYFFRTFLDLKILNIH